MPLPGKKGAQCLWSIFNGINNWHQSGAPLQYVMLLVLAFAQQVVVLFLLFITKRWLWFIQGRSLKECSVHFGSMRLIWCGQ